MISEGLDRSCFHEDSEVWYKLTGSRWSAIHDWLQDHNDIDYLILDDEPLAYGADSFIDKSRLITTDFNEGLTYKDYENILEFWS